MSDSRPDLTGTRLGGLLLDAKLGEGGFGAVYRGKPDVGPARAVKVLHDRAVAAALKKEAETLLALKHPRIVELIQADLTADPPYLVMELAAEGSLAGRLPLDAESALPMVIGILDGLAHAHSKGVAHLDLKPGNILVGADGPKIADFGLARLVAAHGGLEHSQGSTVRGASGSLLYMSPEQREGKAGDTRSDVYSFGVLLCEIITGKLPEANDTLEELLGAPPPAWADATFRGCYCRREKRFPSAVEALAALIAGTATPATAGPPSGKPSPARPQQTSSTGSAPTDPTPASVGATLPRNEFDHDVFRDLYESKANHPLAPGRLQATHGTGDIPHGGLICAKCDGVEDLRPCPNCNGATYDVKTSRIECSKCGNTVSSWQCGRCKATTTIPKSLALRVTSEYLMRALLTFKFLFQMPEETFYANVKRVDGATTFAGPLRLPNFSIVSLLMDAAPASGVLQIGFALRTSLTYEDDFRNCVQYGTAIGKFMEVVYAVARIAPPERSTPRLPKRTITNSIFGGASHAAAAGLGEFAKRLPGGGSAEISLSGSSGVEARLTWRPTGLAVKLEASIVRTPTRAFVLEMNVRVDAERCRGVWAVESIFAALLPMGWACRRC